MERLIKCKFCWLRSIPLLLLALIRFVASDLQTDRQALLDFADKVHHGRQLNWNSSNSLCSPPTWVGVICNANQTRVIRVRLPGVGLSGPIPPNTLSKLDALQILSLRSNMLNGTLPSDISSLPHLNFLYLQNNNFSGTIPSSFSTRLIFIDLSWNSFEGRIPTSFQNLTQLSGLDLENNVLTGPIPDLNLPRLRSLNLSYNHLNGAIPSSLQSFPDSSFVGNSLLCGQPLNPCTPVPLPPVPFVPSSPVPASDHPLTKSSRKVFSKAAIIAIAVGGAVLIFLIALLLLICCLKKKDRKENAAVKGKSISIGGKGEKPKEEYGGGVQGAEKNKLVFFEGCSYNFDLEDLLRASAEVLGKGTFGTAYKAILEEGTTVVVKRLKEVVVGKKDFEQQMEIIGRIGQHRNVVPLRAYYYSKDEKLLVCDFVPAGSLSAILHGNRGSGRASLDWDARVKILLGAARGLAHLHSEAGNKFAHGNIKSSNVLLSSDREGYISDFGLSLLMNFPAMTPRAPGYRAPEIFETKKPTQKSDVYSFGVLILEVLTGKSPLQTSSHDEILDLPRWVQSVVREEWTAEVFDVELMRYQNIEEEMVQMLQLAMSCVGKVPETRPKMEDVVRMVEEIRQPDSDNRPSSKDKSKDSTVQTPEIEN